jgi:hypothetical protein
LRAKAGSRVYDRGLLRAVDFAHRRCDRVDLSAQQLTRACETETGSSSETETVRCVCLCVFARKGCACVCARKVCLCE